MSTFLQYLRDSLQELHQVRWPTRRQAVRLSLIVTVFCLATSAFFGIIDFGLAEAVKALLTTVS